MAEFEFERPELQAAAAALGLVGVKNLGDIPYSFRYRYVLPRSIVDTASPGMEWIIRGAGRGRYRFCLTKVLSLAPNPSLCVTKLPDATPGVISKYALGDEQALLAKERYNRLIDVFTGVACYSLQNHLRSSVPQLGQVETDEIYVGLDRRGAHFIFPVQSKGGNDRLALFKSNKTWNFALESFLT